MPTAQFTFLGVTYVVKVDARGDPVYRDLAHLGGPWSSVTRTVSNPSYDHRFRKLLADAACSLPSKGDER